MTPWPEAEEATLGNAVAGRISLDDMMAILAHRPLKAVRTRFAAHGNADEETRYLRDARLGSHLLERRIKAMFAR